MLNELRNNKKLKRMYHLEGRIARRDGYYILRNVSRATMVTIIKGRIARCNGCMDIFVPHGSRPEKQQVYITRSDIHHLHCTFLSLVNMIWYFADLVSAFCGTLIDEY